jgi:hypothetical protein
MKHIRQKHKNGCLIASVAMVLGITYEAALKLIHPRRKKRKGVALPLIYLLPILKKANIQIKFHFFKWNPDSDIWNIKKMERPTILLIEFDNCNWTHAIAWDPEKKRILDPDRKNALTTKYYQKHLSQFIEFI